MIVLECRRPGEGMTLQPVLPGIVDAIRAVQECRNAAAVAGARGDIREALRLASLAYVGSVLIASAIPRA